MTRARAYFEQFAAEYDKAARESGWRLNGRLAGALAGVGPVGRAVDLACGTGETLAELERALPGCELVGVDLAAAMAERAAARVPRPPWSGPTWPSSWPGRPAAASTS